MKADIVCMRRVDAVRAWRAGIAIGGSRAEAAALYLSSPPTPSARTAHGRVLPVAREAVSWVLAAAAAGCRRAGTVWAVSLHKKASRECRVMQRGGM